MFDINLFFILFLIAVLFGVIYFVMTHRTPFFISAEKSDLCRKANTAQDTQVLVMGIDFGTAFTKVVIRALKSKISLDEYVCAVDFGPLSRAEFSYLLQTALWTDGENVELEERKNFRHVTDLKIRIMQNKSEAVDLKETIAYLALVIRQARRWYEINNGGLLNGINMIWQYNIGIPAETDQETSQPMRDIYHLIGNAAVTLAESPDSINIQAAQNSIKKVTPPDQPTNVAFIPEVVAQAIGYAQGTGIIGGLSIVIDVGAWTLDTCAFILLDAHQANQTRFHIQAARVGVLGCIPLHQERKTAIGVSVDFDTSRPMPLPEFYSNIGSEIEAIKSTDTKFTEKCALQVREILSKAQQVAGREQVFVGKARIPFLVCGGGCHAEPFKRVSQKAWHDYIPAIRNGSENQAIHLTIRKPPDLDAEGIDNDNYHRFSVAWGLSYPDIRYTTPDGTLVVEVDSTIFFPSFEDRGKSKH